MWNTRLPEPYWGSPYPAAGHLLTPPFKKTNSLTMKHLSHTPHLPGLWFFLLSLSAAPAPTFIHCSFLCVFPVSLHQLLIKRSSPWCFCVSPIPFKSQTMWEKQQSNRAIHPSDFSSSPCLLYHYCRCFQVEKNSEGHELNYSTEIQFYLLYEIPQVALS